MCREWVQLATFEVDRDLMHLYRQGRFIPFTAAASELPEVETSADWYRGQRDNLAFARVRASLREAGKSPAEDAP